MTEPPPDTKDWTWVLQRPCPDYGFDSSIFDRSDRKMSGLAPYAARPERTTGWRRGVHFPVSVAAEPPMGTELGARFRSNAAALRWLHDPVHHLWDVEQGFAALREP